MRTRRDHPVAVSAVMSAAVASLLSTACSAGSAGPKTTTARNADLVALSVTAAAKSQKNAGVEDGGTDLGAAQRALSNWKIIERLSHRIGTLESDQSIQALQALAGQLGGYIQESGVDGNGTLQKNDSCAVYYALRIPQRKLKVWEEKSSAIGSVLNVSNSNENIAGGYYDTEAHLSALNTQGDRPLELIKRADKVADTVELEKAPADVIYQVGQLTGTPCQYNSLMNYSTVTVGLFEASKATIIDKTLVTLDERISYQFRQSLRWMGDAGEGALVVVIDDLPILLLFTVVGGIVWLVTHREKCRAKLFVPVNSVDDPGNPPQLPPQE